VVGIGKVYNDIQSHPSTGKQARYNPQADDEFSKGCWWRHVFGHFSMFDIISRSTFQRN
jgi:hypothetical protein